MTYKFDEKMYVVGDAYILHRFVTDDEGHSKEEKIWGILSDYKPNKLTFMTVAKGLIVYWADIQLNDHHIWSPKGRVDTLGNKYDIMMGGLKANTDIIDDNFNIGDAYFIKTPDNWLIKDFYGIYIGYDTEDLWKWPRLNFMTYQSKNVDIELVDILRGEVKLCDLSDHSKMITFDERDQT